MSLTKKVFKEKKSIKGELSKSLENHTAITATMLAKSVGISVYRVKKYCKNHNIDLNNFSVSTLNQKQPKKDKEKSKKNIKKINLIEPQNIKVQLNTPTDIKIKLDDSN